MRLNPAAAYRERQAVIVEEHIEHMAAEVAGVIAYVHLESADHEGPYHVLIGLAPPRVDPADYVERVQAKAMELGELTFRGRVSYDPEATREANTEVIGLRGNGRRLVRPKNWLTLVFDGTAA